MKITDALLGEHAVFYAQFKYLETLLAATPDAECARQLAGLLASALGPHARLENDLLFAAVESAAPERSAPIMVMREEHDEIEAMLAEIAQEAVPRRVGELLGEVIALAREHFEKEEVVAFPLAEETLGATRLHELGTAWGTQRSVRLI
jgi:hemerythrin-like domain-containing protein